MEETKKRGISSKALYYIASAILTITALAWLAFTHQPVSAYSMVLLTALPFVLVAYAITNKKHTPVILLLVSAMILLQTMFVVICVDCSLFVQVISVLIPPMLLTAILCLWWLFDRESFSAFAILLCGTIGIITTYSLTNDMILERVKNNHIAELSAKTMVIKGIYQRNNAYIVDFEQYGPYIVDEDLLTNLNTNDTVLVKATTTDVYDIKRKR